MIEIKTTNNTFIIGKPRKVLLNGEEKNDSIFFYDSKFSDFISEHNTMQLLFTNDKDWISNFLLTKYINKLKIFDKNIYEDKVMITTKANTKLINHRIILKKTAGNWDDNINDDKLDYNKDD